MAPPVGGPNSAVVAAASVGLAPDLKKRVEIMAEHVSRAGSDFESSVKAKNADNPQFTFLFSGEGAEYYQALIQAHGVSRAGSGGTQQVGAGAGPGAVTGGLELAEILRRWPEPQVPPLTADLERRLAEIVAGLEHMASRDAIHAGRQWIEANASIGSAIAGGLLKHLRSLPTSAHRLHVLFLLHDVLQTENTRQEAYRPILAAFRPFFGVMLRPAYQLAQTAVSGGDETQKVMKLLSLWQERGLLTSGEAADIRTLTTAVELPPLPPPPALMGLGQQLQGLAPGLLQQVQAQVHAQQQVQQHMVGRVVPPPRPLAVDAHALKCLQSLQGAPGAQAQQALVLQAPPAGFSGVWQPSIQAAPLAGAMPMPSPAGTLQALPWRGGQTPETVPVGVMAAMLKQVSKRGKDLHTAFVPYKPLDPLYTPQIPPPVAPTTARLMERLAEFYDVVGDCAREPVAALPAPLAADARPRSRSRSRSPGGDASAGVAAGGGGTAAADAAAAGGVPQLQECN